MGFLDFLFGNNAVKKTNTSVLSDTEEKIKREWENIDTLLKKGGPSQLRQALIAADKTLSNALGDLVDGETMGERLKNAKDKFDWEFYQKKIWPSHKMRNNLVHESGYEPPHHMLTSAVEDLRLALNKLGIKV